GLGAAGLRTNAALACGALIVVETIAAPIPINQTSTEYRDRSLAPLPPSIGVGANMPPVYAYLATLPASAVVIELPLGEPAFDLRYMFYSTGHWRRLVNGYSGGFSAEYVFLAESLKDTMSRPAQAWDAIAASTATHAVVHEAVYLGDRGANLSKWLRSNGAREVATFGSDRVFVLRP